jgi:hypothetical protein
MSDDPEFHEYQQFRVDLLNSKFKGTYTEEQMIERLICICTKKNKYALRAIEEAKLNCAPDSRMLNSIWTKGAIYSMANIATPSQTGPAGTDNYGLWRNNSGKR